MYIRQEGACTSSRRVQYRMLLFGFDVLFTMVRAKNKQTNKKKTDSLTQNKSLRSRDGSFFTR